MAVEVDVVWRVEVPEPAIARCWRSRKASVPKEVVSGARSHRGCPHYDS